MSWKAHLKACKDQLQSVIRLLTQGLAQARFLELQGWSCHILSGYPVPERDLTGTLSYRLKNSNFQLFSFISSYAFYSFLALLEKKMKKSADKSYHASTDKCEKSKNKIHIRKTHVY